MPVLGTSRTGSSSSSGGSSVYGTRPAPLPKPNVLGDLRAAIPQFADISSILSQNILNNLQGQLPPQVQNQVLDAVNARNIGLFGANQPITEGNIANEFLRQSLGRQDLGAQQALNLQQVGSQTATLNPALQAQINEFNNLAAALPDPAARGQFELDLFNQYLDRALGTNQNGSGIGTSGGSRMTPGVSYTNLAGDNPVRANLVTSTIPGTTVESKKWVFPDGSSRPYVAGQSAPVFSGTAPSNLFGPPPGRTGFGVGSNIPVNPLPFGSPNPQITTPGTAPIQQYGFDTRPEYGPPVSLFDDQRPVYGPADFPFTGPDQNNSNYIDNLLQNSGIDISLYA